MANSKRKAHCGKVKHQTLLLAQISLTRTLARAKKRHDPIVTGLSAYRCPYCDGWHVGRSLKKGINWDLVAQAEKRLQQWTARAEA